MGRELMRTPSTVVPAYGVGYASPEPALDGPGASALIALGGTTALRDPRVRGAIGNRAVRRIVARRPCDHREGGPAEGERRPD